MVPWKIYICRQGTHRLVILFHVLPSDIFPGFSEEGYFQCSDITGHGVAFLQCLISNMHIFLLYFPPLDRFLLDPNAPFQMSMYHALYMKFYMHTYKESLQNLICMQYTYNNTHTHV